ncbi:MAG: iron-containing alcohol dehydrogenase [Lachnospiraceae bacterium]|nr:iron-containing alcohol dehydrogenase [Lachnospiraceae bacterium]
MVKELLVPKQVFSGEKALEKAGSTIKGLGKKALIVTDSVMVKLGNCAYLEKVLKENDVDFAVFDGINGEPTDKYIEEGLKAYKEAGCDFLIALGGGSPIDSMKAIAALSVSGKKISEYMGKVIDVAMPPTVAIPTTAGTGSEATQFTIITDTEKDIKMLLKGPCLMPGIAVIDPAFTLTAPPKITAATGLDALCHATEAFTSRKATVLADTQALSAVKRIFEYLPIAFHDGSNVKAREEMSVAALEAGVAFNNSSVTIIHGMSRPIGALFHVPHGISNAMLIGEALSFALPGAYDRFAVLGRAIGAATPSDPDEKAAEKYLERLVALTKELEIPTLAEYGIDREKFFASIDKMAEDAMASGSPGNTIREVTKEDIVEIYKKLWD